MSEPAAERKRFPPQIKFIVGNEAAERYSFYGMRSMLTLFMTAYLGFSDAGAEGVYHLFVFGVYFTPVLGAYLADRWWGKYHTIIRLSFIYIAGHAVLAIWESRTGLYAGLALVALGAGGIKPCVSAHVGDQFTKKTKELLPKVFNAFYFSINFGSFFATIISPWTRREFGPGVAFGIPGVLMAIATFVFWLGRHQYNYVQPTGAKPDTPGKVIWFAIRRGFRKARDTFGEQPVEDALAVLRVGRVMLPCMMFWALYDQTGSSWVNLTKHMDMHGFLEPDMLQAANPAMIMILIPVFTGLIYPYFASRGFQNTALGKMRVGMFMTAASFVAVAGVQWAIDAGYNLSAFWILGPYFVLTIAEILVSIVGLEFAYTQAPRTVKSTVMSIWFITISCGNLLASLVAELNVFEGTTKFLFWSGMMAVVGVLFVAVTRGYKVAEYVEDDALAEH